MTVELFGRDLFGEPVRPPSRGPVSDKFVFPPFSVLDGRTGEWQERKAAWRSMGIDGEVGRGASLTYAIPLKSYDAENMAEEYYGDKAQAANTSLFDPVLCELAYRWFSPPSGQIVDPFAGGSVRGVVASALGRRYWGAELRAEQVAANERQADAMALSPRPAWVLGDSRERLDDAPAADFVFSCPPYGDLERYSDDPRDLSAMDWPGFLSAYREIIAKASAKLRRDSFAAFVVGDFRDERGNYRNFPGETIRAFADAGLALYNEAVLVTSVGSASMRVSRQFAAGRKVCKTHQNVLVFVKGDGRRAADACGQMA